ncbi:dihydroorotate dehydrogenase electron transfer subunit [Dictyoglomus sp.]|jgi:dihydroorotate dehydrogenase electron transfer subunit|uniref:dihydroorotate dehydrogenase electron transfer subunit n=1 Tax=Dictyoglomus sp. TaxID=28205 RepID=UPI003D0B743E
MVKDIVGEIVFNKKVGNNIYILSLEAEDVGEIYPGQFAMLRIEDGYDPFLRRPMSLFKKIGNKYYFLYQVVGRGTEILSRKREGEEISILLPLGNSFPKLKERENVLIVGGGVGIAPLNFLVNFYKDQVNFYTFIGFSSFVLEEVYVDFKNYSREFVISSEDSSLGYKGKILDFIPENLDNFEKIISCGPSKMLEILMKKVKDKEKVYLSLEERMGCGFGICLSCAVRGKNRLLHVCKDGPVFCGTEVVFNE